MACAAGARRWPCLRGPWRLLFRIPPMSLTSFRRTARARRSRTTTPTIATAGMRNISGSIEPSRPPGGARRAARPAGCVGARTPLQGRRDRRASERSSAASAGETRKAGEAPNSARPRRLQSCVRGLHVRQGIYCEVTPGCWVGAVAPWADGGPRGRSHREPRLHQLRPALPSRNSSLAQSATRPGARQLRMPLYAFP